MAVHVKGNAGETKREGTVVSWDQQTNTGYVTDLLTDEAFYVLDNIVGGQLLNVGDKVVFWTTPSWFKNGTPVVSGIVSKRFFYAQG